MGCLRVLAGRRLQMGRSELSAAQCGFGFLGCKLRGLRAYGAYLRFRGSGLVCFGVSGFLGLGGAGLSRGFRPG